MANINEVNTGIKFYGMNAVDYSLSTEPGKVMDYETLLRKVAIDRSVKLQAEVIQMSSALKMRQKLVDTLGKAMSCISYMATDLSKEKSYDALHIYTWQNGEFELGQAFMQVGQLTGINLQFSSIERRKDCIILGITKAHTLRNQNTVEYLLDMQNNLLQQEMVSIQSIFNKQSDAFATAKKLTSKVSGTRKNTLQGMA